LTRCEADADCPVEGWCLLGECVPYTGVIPGVPWQPGPHGPLRAGIGEVPLDFPLGITPAGYGGRPGPITPYSPGGMGGSTGLYDRPLVKVLVLDSGDARVILVRLPLCFSVDELTTAMARHVALLTGVDYSGHFVTSAPHSHSDPGRFWNVMADLGLGLLGHGNYSPGIAERMARAAAEAVVQALDGLRPAAFGHALITDFDPDNRISSDRREENPPYKDSTLLVLRVDDLSAGPPGVPLAVWFRLAMHGTILMEPRLSGDAPGGAEMVTRDLLEAHFGVPLSVGFLQGNAGDVSPRGDDIGHEGAARLELIGRRVADWVVPLAERIEPAADVPLGLAVRRIPLSREALGYEPGEFYAEPRFPGDPAAGEYRYGALQCVPEGDGDPATHYEDGRLGCVFDIEELNLRRPLVQGTKTVISVLRLGSLLVGTLPGESVGSLGALLEQELRELPWDGEVTTFGYSQDHNLYLVTADDWFQGGYEAGMNLWGWKLGEHVVHRTVDLARQLLPGAPDDPFVPLKAPWYGDRPELYPLPPPQPTVGQPGEILQEPPAEVSRLDLVDLRFQGGHPALDIPHVVLQRWDGEAFVPFRLPGGRIYDDRDYRMVMDYLGDFAAGPQVWSIRWEEREDFPAGRYRFAITGQALLGEEVQPYTGASREFVLTPRRMPLPGPEIDGPGRTVQVRLLYPPTPTDDDGVNDFETLHLLGHRLRSLEVDGRFGAPAPVTATVEVQVRDGEGAAVAVTDVQLQRTRYTARLVTRRAQGVEQVVEHPDKPATLLTASFAEGGGPPYQVARVEVQDEWGNRWVYGE